MAGNGSENTAMETRNEFLVSRSISIRVGHFLNPSFSTANNALPNLPPRAFTYNRNNSGSLEVNFKGWQTPYRPWNEWIQRMEPHHGPMWRRLGIFDAIKNSTLQIIPHKEVVLGLARKWFPETSSFVFKWGEASLTIEDVSVLGGYSPLGDSVSQSLDANTQAIVGVDQRLMEARRFISQSSVHKVPLNRWIKLFQGNVNGYGDLEHVAFLTFWLSKYIFPKGTNVVGKHVHTIAIRLAMGVRIALAPAILASIYRDLRILKSAISSPSALNLGERKGVWLYAPMHLVQIWAWERFRGLRPRSNPIEPNQQIMARWHNCLRSMLESNVDLVIESGAMRFSWRPYARFFGNQELTKSMYKNGEQWVLDCSELEAEVEALVKFVTPCELVGLGCIEQYLPHRVARQFGFDQDLPGPVSRRDQNYDTALADYNRPIRDEMLYIPPRMVKTEVTTRYLAWWNRSKSVVEALPPQLRGD